MRVKRKDQASPDLFSGGVPPDADVNVRVELSHLAEALLDSAATMRISL